MNGNAGKYGDECAEAMAGTEAEAVLLIVKNGKKGDGFSLAVDPKRVDLVQIIASVPSVLRSVALAIERGEFDTEN
jgi:hypothetical protein